MLDDFSEMSSLVTRSRELALLLIVVFGLIALFVGLHIAHLSQQRRERLLRILGLANPEPTPVSMTNDRSTPASGRRGESMQTASEDSLIPRRSSIRPASQRAHAIARR